ncbi:MAG: transporter substrate-binding domain-containing protein [Campylobacter sp.]|nr:transporter substrate-binding domain-containing protein [Campylobacter sp.]
MRNTPGVNVVPTEVIFTAIMSLQNGKIDAVCVDSSVGIEYIKKNDDIEEFYRENDGSDGFSFAFDKGKHTALINKLNAALNDMKKDGSYDKLLEKYNLK